MTDQKFNPIKDAELPPLPGQDVTHDIIIENTQDAQSREKIPTPTPPVPNPQKKIIFNSVEPKVVEEETSHSKVAVRYVVLISLIAIIFVGFVLTIRFIPKIVSAVGSLFTQKNTTTQNVPVTVTTTGMPYATTSEITNIPLYTTPIKTSTSTNNVSPNKYADLKVEVLSINTIAGGVSVKFNVQNIGNTTSGTWTFRADLPEARNPVYYSQIQSPITPQSGVVYTLQFTVTPSQYNQVVIKLFPSGTEVNKNNNTIYRTF